MKRKRIDIITLGCSKNLVDSEQLMRQLEEVGYSVTHDTENPQDQKGAHLLFTPNLDEPS